MISAGWRELSSAFKQHSQVLNVSFSVQRTRHLLLFYAVECGLKAIYLRRNQFGSTDQISDKKLRKSHELDLWVKELKLPAVVTDENIAFRLQKDKSSKNCQSWRIEHAHQAWRYGVVIDTNDEQSLVNWLSRVRKWVQENINQ